MLSQALRAVWRAGDALLVGFLRKIIPASVPWGPPKGFFSDYELLRNGKVDGKILLESQVVPPAAPESLRLKCRLEQTLFQPWPIFWTRHPQARLVAHSLVLLDDQKRLSREAAFGPSAKTDPAYGNIFLPPVTRLDGHWTSLRSRWGDGFFHWFLDALPRLALLPELPPDTRIIVPARLASFQQDSLRWLGLEDRIRPTRENHLLIEQYYFCSFTSMTGCFNPFGVQFLRQSFLPHADQDDKPPPRFYLRRVGHARPIDNENELLDFFQKKGWAIVDTEQLSLSRQIRLFSKAEMICAPHGAGLTNLLWCSPGCRVLELCASTFLNGVYEGLAQCLALRYRFLISDGDFAYHSRVKLNELERALEF